MKKLELLFQLGLLTSIVNLQPSSRYSICCCTELSVLKHSLVRAAKSLYRSYHGSGSSSSINC
jgi:hypothetical protein